MPAIHWTKSPQCSELEHGSLIEPISLEPIACVGCDPATAVSSQTPHPPRDIAPFQLEYISDG